MLKYRRNNFGKPTPSDIINKKFSQGNTSYNINSESFNRNNSSIKYNQGPNKNTELSSNHRITRGAENMINRGIKFFKETSSINENSHVDKLNFETETSNIDNISSNFGNNYIKQSQNLLLESNIENSTRKATQNLLYTNYNNSSTIDTKTNGQTNKERLLRLSEQLSTHSNSSIQNNIVSKKENLENFKIPKSSEELTGNFNHSVNDLTNKTNLLGSMKAVNYNSSIHNSDR